MVHILRLSALVLCASHGVLGDSITVESPGVKFVGLQNKTSMINTFMGIRYAQAPTGNRRWRAPVLVEYNNEVDTPLQLIDGIRPGPMCVQSSPYWGLEGATAAARVRKREDNGDESEDCLLLNIQTPMIPKYQRLPVLVYIHGGGYVAGGQIASTGDSLVGQSNGTMIFVGLQYRLGPLGFLSGNDVKKDGTANAGLLDQRMALKWIRSNIHIFGGDPNRVTISGGSAGGGSVTMQMVMYGGSEEAPFQAAIPGAEFPWWTPLYDNGWQQQQYREFLRAARCSSLKCLRDASLSRIRSATETAFRTAYHHKDYAFGTFYWGPVVDGHVIPDHPARQFRNGHFTKVPVMMYRNFDEGFLFTNFSLASESEVMSDLTSLWHDSDGFFAETVSMLYPTSLYNRTHLDALTIYPEVREARVLESPLSDSFVKRSAIIGDALVNCPTRHIARSVVKYGQPAYKLVFDAGYQFHGTTDYYLYSSVTHADGSNGGEFSFPGNATLAKIMRGYYISFALNHDPNGDGDKTAKPSWPKYQEDDSKVLWVGYTDIEGRADPDNSANCQFLLNTRGTNCGLVEDW
ncbi:unnamed protein product [Colletotrichum noveboracense]|uniref:Carboxylic ester hydrolase n=1 Tax=Colletotrichum noveboracense TaxID=2664923 RepID=A0A9W4W767_9PEZI|nr:hypothetical protein K456DRAFT_33443 [Colletotrichum gloeosporioides 23]CAI0645327.1 unnamed protein product [Colletotrichum noveboracense]